MISGSPPAIGVWTKLADVTLGSASGTIDSGAFTNMKIMRVYIFAKLPSAAGSAYLRFNSDNGSNYAYMRIMGTGSGNATSDNGSTNALYCASQGNNQSYFVNGEIFQADTTLPKLIHVQAGAGANDACHITNGQWNNTANDLTSIQLLAPSGTFAIGSRIVVHGYNI